MAVAAKGTAISEADDAEDDDEFKDKLMAFNAEVLLMLISALLLLVSSILALFVLLFRNLLRMFDVDLERFLDIRWLYESAKFGVVVVFVSVTRFIISIQIKEKWRLFFCIILLLYV